MNKTGALARSFACASALSLFGSTAFAAITISSVGGVSNTDLTATTPTIWGGVAGDLVGGCVTESRTNSSTCNNCIADAGTGDARFVACNESRVHPQLQVTITVVSDSAESGRPMITDSENGALTLVDTPTTVTKGQAGTVTILWSTLCQEMTDSTTSAAGGPDCDPDVQLSGTFKVGIDTDGNNKLNGSSDDAKEVTITVHKDIGATHTDCNNTQDFEGVCQFDINPGDEKVVLKNLQAAGAFPVSTRINFKAVRVYYATEDEGGFSAINPASAHADLVVESDDTTSFVLNSDRVTGLANDIKYFFKVAVVDQAGNIGYFTPDTLDIDCADTAGEPPCHTSKPGAVTGVLADDMNCFIATAAFGSPMASQVQMFRQFRNRFLLPNTWGRAFVHAYYDFGPKAAHFIAQSEGRRAVARVALAPAWLFAWASLRLGFWTTLLLALASFSAPLIAFAAIQQRRRRT